MSAFLIIIWAFFFSLIVGLTSVGTGSIGTAGLIILFHLNPQTAVASNIVNGTIMKGVGSIKHHSHKHIQTAAAIPFVLGGMPAVFVGSLYSRFLDPNLFKLIIGCVLIALSLLLFSQIPHHSSKEGNCFQSLSQRQKVYAFFSGLAIGFLVGLTSVGTGTLIITSMFVLVKLISRQAVGTSLFAGLVILSLGSISHLLLAQVDYKLVLYLLTGSIPGVLVGSQLCSKLPLSKVRVIAYLLIMVGGVKMISDYILAVR